MTCRSSAKIIFTASIISLTGLSVASAQSLKTLTNDPLILGFHLGMSQSDIKDWFSAHKLEYPAPQINSGKVQLDGVMPFDGVITVRSIKDKTEENFLFEFSPPFDGNVLVGILRSVNYGLDANAGPNYRDLEKALFSRYGEFPSSTFFGQNMFWVSGGTLSEEGELRQCTYTNGLNFQALLPATKGCGLTLDVEITNNSSHPGSVFIYQSTLWDQDRIVAYEQKAISMARAGAEEKAKASQNTAVPPKL